MGVLVDREGRARAEVRRKIDSRVLRVASLESGRLCGS